MSANEPHAYVRIAQPSEHSDVTRVLTRAFAKDPAMNWYGCVPEAVNDLDNPTRTAKRTMRNLQWFQEALVKATNLVDGYVTVAIIPRSEEAGDGQKEGKERSPESYKKEEIVGVAMWLPPGKTLDMGPITIIRSGLLKRVLLDFSPAVERTLEKSFKARGLDRRDSWHLLQMVVDPLHQGKGISTLLVEEGFRRVSPKPVHLEATKASTRDIYAHFGFEVDEEHQFGVGAVDVFGVKARGKEATGYPEWVMTKVSTSAYVPEPDLMHCMLVQQWST
ncbi:hypothetical protein C8Q74DRAFT_1411002 [Fomes fomentarius]|nr:hypothetical protein C8Q74DRAFT_1411002 [Fomes fomentarius]